MRSPAGAPPKVHRSRADREKNAGGYGAAHLVSSPQKQKVSSGQDMSNQFTHSFDAIGWNESLFSEYIVELRVVVIRKAKIIRLLHAHAQPNGSADGLTAWR